MKHHDVLKKKKKKVGNLVWLDRRGERGANILLGEGIWTFPHRIYSEKNLFGKSERDGLE